LRSRRDESQATRRRATPAQLERQRHEQVREELRRFARFLDQQDRELAASVTQLDSTLEACARIDRFFKTYVTALAERRAH
jgi:hypothetical protein